MPTPPAPDSLALAAAIDSVEERVGAELADHLRGLVPPPRWVDADARDPPESGVYLVMRGDYYDVALYDGEEGWALYGNVSIGPSYWMVLPNPPGESSRAAPGQASLPLF